MLNVKILHKKSKKTKHTKIQSAHGAWAHQNITWAINKNANNTPLFIVS